MVVVTGGVGCSGGCGGVSCSGDCGGVGCSGGTGSRELFSQSYICFTWTIRCINVELIQ